MRRHSLILWAAMAAAFTGYLLGAGVLAVRQPWAVRVVRDAAAQEIAHRLGIVIAAGPAEGHLMGELVIHGLAAGRAERLPGGFALRVERAQADYRLWALLLERVAFVGRLDRLRLEGLEAQVERGSDGVAGLSGANQGRKRSRYAHEGPRVVVEGARVHYLDRQRLSPDGQPLEVTATVASAAFGLGQLVEAARGGGGDVGDLSASARVRLRSGVQGVEAEARVQGGVVSLDRAAFRDAGAGDWLRVRALRAELDLAALLGGRVRSASALHELVAEAPRGSLSLDRAGHLNALRHIQRWSSATPKPGRIAYEFVASEGHVVVRDPRLGADGTGSIELAELDAQLDMGRLDRALHSDQTETAGVVRGRVTLTTARLRAQAALRSDVTTRLSLRGLQASEGGRELALADEVRLAYDLGQVRRRGVRAGLQGLEADGLRAWLALDQRNRPTFLAGLSGGTGATPQTSPRPASPLPVRLTDADLNASVAALGRPGAPLEVRVVTPRLTLDAGAWQGGRGSLGEGEGLVEMSTGRLRGAGRFALVGDHDVRLSALQVREGRQESVRADEIMLALRPSGAAGLALREARVEGLRAHLTLSGNGRIGLLDALGAGTKRRGGSASSGYYLPRVNLTRGDLTLDDRRTGSSVTTWRARGVEGEVDLGALRRAQRGARAAGIGRVAASLSAAGPGMRLGATARADLSGQLTLSQIALETTPGADAIRLRQAVVRFAPGQLLGADPLKALRSLELRDGYARLVRDQGGALRLVGALSAGQRGRSRARRPVRLPDAEVQVSGVSLSLVDRSASPGPVTTTLVGLEGSAWPRRPGRGTLSATLRSTGPQARATARLRTDLASWATLREASLWELAGDRAQRLVGAREATVRYSLGELLNGRGAAALAGVRLRSANVVVERRRDGQSSLQHLVTSLAGRLATARRRNGLAGCDPLVDVRDSRVTYRDAQTPGGTTTLVARSLRGQFRPASLWTSTRPSAWGRRSGALHGQLVLASPDLRGSASVIWRPAGQVSVAALDAQERRGATWVRAADVGRVTVGYAPAALRGPRPPEALRQVWLVRPCLDLVRGADGKLAAGRLVEALAHSGAKPPSRQASRPDLGVTVWGGQLAYVDLAATHGAGPLEVELQGVAAHLPVGQLQRLLRGLPAEGSRVSGQISSSWPEASFKASVTTDLAWHTEMSDVALQSHAPDGPRLAARSVEGRLPLAGLAWGGVSPVAALDRLRLAGLEGQLQRAADGTWDVADLFSSFRSAGAEPVTASLDGLHGRLWMADSGLQVTDHASNPEGPVSVVLAGGDGDIDLFRVRGLLDALRQCSEAGAPAPRPDLRGLGRLRGTLLVSVPGGRLSTVLDSRDLAQGARLEEVRLSDAGGHEHLRARSLEAALDLADAASGQRSWLASLRRAALDGAWVSLARDRGGRVDLLELARGFGGGGKPAGRPTDGLLAQVRVSDTSVHWEDRATSAGPVVAEVTGLTGTLDGARLASVRRGEDTSGVGRLRGDLHAQAPGETLTAGVDWNLDGALELQGLHAAAPGAPSPRLALDRAAARYDLVALLGPPEGRVASIQSVSLGSGRVTAWQAEGGRWTVSRVLEAYQSLSPAGPSGSDELGGLRARVQAAALSAEVAGHTASGQPLRVSLRETSGDVDLRRLADLRAGKSGPSAGWVRGQVDARLAEARLSTRASLDLGGAASFEGLLLTDHNGARTVGQADLASLRFDPAQALRREPTPAGLAEVSLSGARGEIVMDESGRWELARLFTTSAARPDEPSWTAEDFVPRVRLGDVSVTYRSRAQASSQAPRSLSVRGLEGEVDLGTFWLARRTGEALDPGELSGEVDVEWPDARVATRFSSDLVGSLELWDADFTGEVDGTRRCLLSACHAQLQGRLAEALVQGPSPEQLRSLEAWDLTSDLTRQADGRLALPASLRSTRQEDATPAPLRLAGTVSLHRADANYEDQSVSVPGGVAVGARDLEGTVDLGALQAAADGKAVASAGDLTGRIAGHFGRYTLQGAVRVDAARQLEARDLVAREGFTGPTVVTARTLSASYDVGGLLARRGVLSQVSEVVADGLVVDLVREADGSLRVAQGLKLAGPSAGRSTDRFDGAVRLLDSRVSLVDYASGRTAPLEVSASGLSGLLRLGALAQMRQDGEYQDAGELRASVAARLGDIQGQASVEGRISEGLAATGVHLSVPDGAAGQIVSVPRMLAQYDLAPILRQGGRDWAAHVKHLALYEADGRLTREADGRLRLERLLTDALATHPSAAPESPSPSVLDTFAGRLSVEDGRLALTDRRLLKDGPAELSADDVFVDADVGALRSGGAHADPVGVLSAQVSLDAAGEEWTAILGGALSDQVSLLNVSGRSGTTGQSLLTAGRIGVRLDTANLLGQPLSAERLLAAVREVELASVQGVLGRDGGGHWTSPALLAAVTAETGTGARGGWSPGPVDLRVLARQVALRYEQGDPEAGALSLEVADTGGTVSLQGDLAAGAAEPLRVAGSLQGRATLSTAYSTLQGGFETDLFRTLRLTNAQGLAPDGAELARAKVAGVGYDLRELLAGRRGLSVVRSAELEDGWAAVSTSAAGDLIVAGVKVGTGRLQGQTGGEPVTLGALSGSVTAGADGVMRGQLAAEGPGGLLGRAQAQVMYDPADDWLDVEGGSDGVELAGLGRLLLPADHAEIARGTATLEGAAYGHLRTGVAWSLGGEVTDGQARVARLGDQPVAFGGPVSATSEGVHTDGLKLSWAGCEATVTGGLVDLHAPALALDVAGQAARGSDLLGLLPRSQRAQAQTLLFSRPVDVRARVAGPLRAAACDLELTTTGDVVLAAGRAGALRLAGVDVRGLGLDWTGDALQAAATAGAVTLERDGSVTDALAQLESGAVMPAARQARIRLAQEAQGTLRVNLQAPWTRLRGVVGTDLEADAVVDGRQVQVDRIAATLLGGQLRGAGLLDLSGSPGPWAQGRVELVGGQLEGLRALDVWPPATQVQGTVDAVAQGAVGGDGAAWAVQAQAQDARVGSADYERANLVAHGTPEGVRLDLAEVAHGDGRLWARGFVRRDPDAPTQGPLGGLAGDLHLAAADFPLGGFPGLTGKSWTSGSLYATASLEGALADPAASLEANLFGLSEETGEDSVAALRLRRDGPQLRIAHAVVAAGRSTLAATDLLVDDFALDWSREGHLLPRVDGRIVQGPVQGVARAGDVARIAGESRPVGGWAGLAGEVGGTLRRPRLGASVTVSNLQVGEWLVNQGDLETELADDHLVVGRATVRAGDTTAAFMGRVDDVYRGRNYNLVGSIRELSLAQLPPVQRLDADVRGRADVTRIALWGRKGESVAGSATVNLEITRLGTQSFRPFTGLVQFSSGLVRLEATRIRRAVAEGARDAGGGFIGLSALFSPAQRLVEAELRLSGPRGVTETRALAPEQVRGLPEVASTLALAAPLVQAAEMASRERSGQPTPAGDSPAAAAPPLWESLTSLSLRTAGRVVGSLRVGGPLDDLYCSGALRLWDVRLDGRALPRDISASADVALQDRRLENIALKAVDGSQELELAGSADLPVKGQDGAHRRLALKASGKDIDVPAWRHWLPGAVVLGGTAGFDITASGTTGAPTVQARLDIRDPSGAGARFDRLTLPQVEVREGSVRVTGAELVRSGQASGGGAATPEQRVALSGTLPWTWRKPWVPPDQPMDMAVTVRGPDLGFLPALLNDVAMASAGARRSGTPSVWSSLRTGGAVDAQVAVTGTPGAPQLNGHVTIEGGSLQGRAWEAPLDGIRLAARLASEGGRTRLVADTARARWGNTLAEADGSWAYLDQLSKGKAMENEYHAEVRLRLPETSGGTAAPLWPMVIGGVRLGGLQGKVTVNTLSQALSGVPGSTSSRVHRLNLEDLTVLMDVPEAPGPSTPATGAVANKSGTLKASGWMELSDLRPARLALNRHDLTLKADNALVRVRDMLAGRLNGSLRATRAFGPGGLTPGRATGKVEGKLVLSDAQIGGKLPGGGARGQARALPASYASPAFDVRLLVGPGVRVSGMGAYVPLAQAEIARLSGTLQAPLLQGRVTAVSGSGAGRVSLPAGAIDVRSGWVDYRLGVPPGAQVQDRMPLVLTGALQAEGSTRITVSESGGATRSYDVGLVLTGTLPDRVNLEVDDVAGLTRDQILAHLGTAPLGGLSAAGQRVEDLVSERALSLLAAGLRTTLLAPLETEVMRRLGLSELTINYGANQEFEVAIGKYVLRDLQIAYRRAVGGAAGDRYTLSLSYRLKNRLMVAYTTNELSESHVRVSYVTEY